MVNDERLEKLVRNMMEEYNELEDRTPEAPQEITEEKRIESLRIMDEQLKILRWLEENKVILRLETIKLPQTFRMYIKFERIAKENELVNP